MITKIFGKKIGESQKFLTDGTRIPVTEIQVPDALVTLVKTKEKNGYLAVQLAIATRLFREVRFNEAREEQLPKKGDVIKVAEILKPGDVVDITGVSKGKGFAGVVKRHHFKGGPRTHGQSDRERAPGSIGQTTTPGRVYKGKRMAGRMGQDQVTVKNLKVVDVLEGKIFIKGLVPGGKNNLLAIQKTGEDKKFVGIYKGEEDAKS